MSVLHESVHCLRTVVPWDMEGMVCKRKDRTYSSTAGWLNVMNPHYTEREGRHDMFAKFRERRVGQEVLNTR